MKHLIVTVFAATLALSSLSLLAADTDMKTDQPKAESKTEKAKDYVADKAHKAKVKTKRAARKTKSKVKSAVANRKTTEPASVSESRPDVPPPSK